jgi:hypothetical protein
MDHIRHAPETNRNGAVGDLVPHPWPATLQDIRIKQSDTSAIKIDVPVKLDANAGITSRLRLFRQDAAQIDPSVSFQIAPDNAPLAPATADQSPADDVLKRVYPGIITVRLPNDEKRQLTLPDIALIDLTQGVDVRCSIGFDVASPVGPMLNVDVTLYPKPPL